MHPFDDRDVLREVLAELGTPRMIALPWPRSAELTGGELTGAAATRRVTGAVTLDSRTVGAGDLFVAVAGERVDGHDFVDAAAASGAVGRAHHPSARRAALPSSCADPVAALGRLAAGVHERLSAPAACATLGITGSSGKTSTKDLLGPGARRGRPDGQPARARTTTTSGCRSPCSTPTSAPASSCWRWARAGPGTSPGSAASPAPQVGVVLNVGSAHLGEFGSPEGIAAAKGELVEALPEDGTAVLNADDPRVLGMAVRTAARVLATGRGHDADVRAVDVVLDDAGPGPVHAPRRRGEAAPGRRCRWSASTRWPTRCPPRGPPWPSGMTPADVAAALSAAEPRSRWRMEVARRADGVTVVNDAYNANPESMRAALAALAGMAGHAADRRPRRHGRARRGRRRRARAARPRRGRRRGRPDRCRRAPMR